MVSTFKGMFTAASRAFLEPWGKGGRSSPSSGEQMWAWTESMPLTTNLLFPGGCAAPAEG